MAGRFPDFEPFAEDSIVREWFGENANAVGTQRAFLMQAAHPSIAMSIKDKPRYRTETLARLKDTVQSIDIMVFGTKTEGQAVVDEINKAHKDVHGRLDESVGSHKLNEPYSAFNPDPFYWVWESLVDTVIHTRKNFINGETTDAEVEHFYQESKKLLPPLGGNIEHAPATYAALQADIEQRIASGNVAVSQHARDVVAPVILFKKPIKFPHIPVPVPLAIPMYPLTKAAIGGLHPELRRQYGLKWSKRDQVIYDRTTEASRRFYTNHGELIPNIIRQTPQARKTQVRLAA